MCGEWAALKGCSDRYNMIQDPVFGDYPAFHYEYVYSYDEGAGAVAFSQRFVLRTS